MRLLALLLLASPLALADPAGIARCRAIAEPAARLACYDALPVPAADAKAAAAVPVQTPQQFGLENREVAGYLDKIDSSIAGRFDGWGPNSVFRLANGQSWQVVDGSSGAHWIENPKVLVRRGALGAFFLEIEGTNRSPRVARVR